MTTELLKEGMDWFSFFFFVQLLKLVEGLISIHRSFHSEPVGPPEPEVNSTFEAEPSEVFTGNEQVRNLGVPHEAPDRSRVTAQHVDAGVLRVIPDPDGAAKEQSGPHRLLYHHLSSILDLWDSPVV